MEIGQQLIDYSELVTGFDENVCFGWAGLNKRCRFSGVPTVYEGRFRGRILEGAHDRGSHSQDGAGVAPGAANCRCRFFWNFVPLEMDLMIFDFFHINGLKRSESD